MRRNVPKEVIAAIEEDRMDLPGVLVQVEPVRQYPYGTLAAHMLGYLGEINDRELQDRRSEGYEGGDLIGKDGVERVYDRLLRGQGGQIQAEVDAQGRPLRVLATLPSTPGNSLILGIDLDVQQAAEDALGERVGAVVAMDPRDGTIIALASHPSFDPNLFATGIGSEAWTKLLRTPLQPLLDRAIQGAYPTGSVFKIVTATAALELGLVQADSRFYCPGYYTLSDHVFHDDVLPSGAKVSHGHLTFLSGIAESCNVVFWTLAQPIGARQLSRYAHLYGLGQATGIDLVQENPGVIPDPRWKARV